MELVGDEGGSFRSFRFHCERNVCSQSLIRQHSLPNGHVRSWARGSVVAFQHICCSVLLCKTCGNCLETKVMLSQQVEESIQMYTRYPYNYVSSNRNYSTAVLGKQILICTLYFTLKQYREHIFAIFSIGCVSGKYAFLGLYSKQTSFWSYFSWFRLGKYDLLGSNLSCTSFCHTFTRLRSGKIWLT